MPGSSAYLRQKGVYAFVLGGETEPRLLNIRTFGHKQGGVCPKCGGHFAYEDMQGDHVTPWSRGGHTEYGNLQMLCKKCNREKSDR